MLFLSATIYSKLMETPVKMHIVTKRKYYVNLCSPHAAQKSHAFFIFKTINKGAVIMESIICSLAGYTADEKQIKQDICSMPLYGIDELCSKVIEEIDAQGRLHPTPKDENKRMSHLAYISYLTPRRGILSSSLLYLFIMQKRKD